MAESLKRKTFKGSIWSAFEAFSIQGIQFIVMLVMARILTPSDYGIIGMLSIFIAISNAIIDSGFGQSLIRKNDGSEIDNSTVFYFNLVLGIVLYLILFFCAPLISRFYNQPVLTPVTRIIGINLIINSLCIVQSAHYTKRLDFKTQAKATITASIISGITGIAMAYMGYGVWALVTQQIVSCFISTSLLWYFSSWRPIFTFSWISFKELFSFGSKLLISGIIDVTYNNTYQITIGKIYKASDLGFYTRAQGFSSLVSNSMMSIIQRVTFPVLCSIKEDDAKLEEGYRKLLRISGFLIFPLMLGMASIAYPLILTLIGEKWMFTAKLMLPICLAGMWYPVHSINLNLLKVKGRSDLFLKLEIIKKFFGILVLIGSIPLGVYWMCWGLLLSSLIALIINTHYTGKLIGLGIIKQFKDLFPIIMLSFGMGVIVWFTVSFLSFPSPALLVIGIFEGMGVYIVGAKLLKFHEFKELSTLIKKKNK